MFRPRKMIRLKRWQVLTWTCLIAAMLAASTSRTVGALGNRVSDVSACAGLAASSMMAPGNYDRQMQVGDLQRSYLLHIPTGYDATVRVPLVISLHGFVSTAREQAYWTQWDQLADQYGFIVVYPQGTGVPTRWNSGLNRFTDDNKVDDMQFMRDLVGTLSGTGPNSLCIDARRIYVNGLSNGGGMTYRMACEMAEQIAAIGTVAGAYSELTNGCHPSQPVPVIAFHGTADPIVKFNGDERLGLPRITDWVAGWADRNHCTSVEDIPPQGDVTGLRYLGCADGGDVIFYRVAGGGHTWPGGNSPPAFIVGKTTSAINATELMWTFFEQHPLPDDRR